MDGAFFEFIVADHYVYYILLYRRMNEFSREKMRKDVWSAVEATH